MMRDWAIVEIGVQIYLVEIVATCLFFVPCRIYDFDTVYFNPHDLRMASVIDSDYLSPLVDNISFVKALLLEEITR